MRITVKWHTEAGHEFEEFFTSYAPALSLYNKVISKDSVIYARMYTWAQTYEVYTK